MDYPITPTVPAVEEQAGVRLPDPYRWLEDGHHPDVREWTRAQAALATAHVTEWPHLDRVRELVGTYTTDRFGAIPRFAAGRWFRTERPRAGNNQVVIVAGEHYGDGRVLFDSTTEDGPEHVAVISWMSPSPDGLVLAVGVCTDGSENNTIRLIDVEHGSLRADAPPQLLHDNWVGGAMWLPDSTGFYYLALSEGGTEAFEQQLFRHMLGAPPPPTPEAIPSPEDASHHYQVVTFSDDGRTAVANQRFMTPIPVALRSLEHDEPWRPFVTDYDGTLQGFALGEHFIALATDGDSPRGRVVAIPLDSPTPNDPSTWSELVSPSEAVLRTLQRVGGVLYLTEFVGTYARVRVVSLDGTDHGEVPLPGSGAIAEMPFPIMELVPKGHPDEFIFGYSSLTESWGVYRHVPGAGQIEQLKSPDVRLPDAVVEDRWAASPDGTLVPYHVVRRTDVDPDAPQPTLMYAYGGFNVAWLPQFPAANATFVAAGGIYVHCHLRGGAEFGLEWWQGGRMGNKQNCYADLYAIAEQLIADGVTTRDQLALTGGSNGGLLCGVALTQRPDLWAAVIPQVPFLDVIGACREPYGRTAVASEFGNPDEPDEIRRMTGFSPYHLVEDGRTYPPTYINAGDTDPRCPPWHARKLIARLQATQAESHAAAGSAPLLCHMWENVGHGWATARDTTLRQNTEWLAFAMRHTGLVPR